MKLGELKGAIRKAKGNPSMTLLSPPNATRNMNLVVQKTALLEELTNIYPNERSFETGMEFDSETGVISCPSIDIGGGGSIGSVTRISDGENSHIEIKDSAGNVRIRIGAWPEEGEVVDVVGLHSESEAANPVDDDPIDPEEDAIGVEIEDDLESMDDIDLGDDDDDDDIIIDLED